MSKSRKFLYAILTLILFLAAVEILLRLTRPNWILLGNAWYRLHDCPTWNGHDLKPNARVRLNLANADRTVVDFVVQTDENRLRCSESASGRTQPSKGQSQFLDNHVVHCIGDSFTMGWGVPFEHSYPCVLGEILGQPYRVLNLGDAGFGLIAAKTKSGIVAAHSPPSTVLWLFEPSDFDDDRKPHSIQQSGSASHLFRKSLHLAGEHLYLASTPFAIRASLLYESNVRTPDERIQSRMQTPDAIDRVVNAATREIATLASAIPPDFQNETLHALAELHAQTTASQQRLAIVLLRPETTQSAAVFQVAQKLRVETLCFPDRTEWTIAGDGHLNQYGNRELARLIARRFFSKPEDQ